MAFSNKGRHVKRGDRVSGIIVMFRADGLVVDGVVRVTISTVTNVAECCRTTGLTSHLIFFRFITG